MAGRTAFFSCCADISFRVWWISFESWQFGWSKMHKKAKTTGSTWLSLLNRHHQTPNKCEYVTIWYRKWRCACKLWNHLWPLILSSSSEHKFLWKWFSVRANIRCGCASMERVLFLVIWNIPDNYCCNGGKSARKYHCDRLVVSEREKRVGTKQKSKKLIEFVWWNRFIWCVLFQR